MTITCREMVQREVIYCASSLISALATLAADASSAAQEDAGVDYEELLDLHRGYGSWEDAAREHIAQMDREDLKDALEGYVEDPENLVHMLDRELRERLIQELGAAGDWEDFCDIHRVDREEYAVYEHWIVSDWLARRLENKGEVVARDVAGLTIWGRGSTGQFIYMDHVIQEIYKDLTGQEATYD